MRIIHGFLFIYVTAVRTTHNSDRPEATGQTTHACHAVLIKKYEIREVLDGKEELKVRKELRWERKTDLKF